MESLLNSKFRYSNYLDKLDLILISSFEYSLRFDIRKVLSVKFCQKTFSALKFAAKNFSVFLKFNLYFDKVKFTGLLDYRPLCHLLNNLAVNSHKNFTFVFWIDDTLENFIEKREHLQNSYGLKSSASERPGEMWKLTI